MTDKRPFSFRHPVNNVRYTRLLFWEQQGLLPIAQQKIDPIYTLHIDKPGLINFRKRYVALGDPTGWKVAQELLEDYSHWQLLMKCPWFREAKEIWDAELDAKLASEGLDAIKQFAGGVEGVSDAITLTAARYLADKAYKRSPKPEAATKRGRPSKEEVEGNLKAETADAAEVAKDLDRISSAGGVFPLPRLVKG